MLSTIRGGFEISETGAPTPKGVPTYFLVKFENWAKWVVRSKFYYVDPPLTMSQENENPLQHIRKSL